MSVNRRIKMTLDVDSIQNAIKELNAYRDSINSKAELFIKELAKVGIATAKENTGVLDDNGNVGYLITFTCETEPSVTGCTGLMIATEEATLQKAWLSIDDNGNEIVKTAEISPLLMYEYGSGQKAIEGKYGGIGTFPSNLNNPPNKNHAIDGTEWYWKALDGTWHHSDGIKPTQPMYKAWEDMKKKIRRVAIQVFREN